MNKTPVTLPVLSDTMHSGRLARWLKQSGDAVKVGDVLAEVESDKAVMDVEAYADGYLAGPLAATGEDLPVKSTIAWIVDDAAAASESAEPALGSEPPASSAQPPEPVSSEPAAAAAPQRQTEHSAVVAAALAPRNQPDGGDSTFARGLANELGLDITQIDAGPDGRVGAAQVLAAAIGPRLQHLSLGLVERIERPTPLKAAMAERMAAATQAPMYHVSSAANLSALRRVAQTEHDSLTLLLARACALTLQAHPLFNACWTPRGLARRERVDIGIAVDSDAGLITPVLRDAARPLAKLAADWCALKEKAERRRLTLHEYSGATFYLSNLGNFPVVTRFDAVVPPGATAILAVAAADAAGRAELTVTCDHRVVAGADAARFLATLVDHLSQPRSLAE